MISYSFFDIYIDNIDKDTNKMMIIGEVSRDILEFLNDNLKYKYG